MKGKICNIYERIQNGSSRTCYPGINNNIFQEVPTLYTSLHHNILPNYLKTFIYRMSNCILPLKCNYTVYGLDTDSRCEFCNLHYETNYHVFLECTFVVKLWKKLEIMTGLKLLNTNIVNFKHNHTENDHNLIVYCTALMCHKIWQLRNEIRHENRVTYDEDYIFNKFKRSFHSRKYFELRRENSQYASDFIRLEQRSLFL